MKRSHFAALALLLLAAAPGFAQFPPLGNDVTTSLGSFRIQINQQFQPLFTNYPGYNATTHILASPTLFDPQTLIGRSSALLDSSGSDANGVPVGTANTIISDAALIPPPGFGLGAGTREVHTEVRSLHMTSGAVAVRGGIWYDSPAHTTIPPSRISPGEVESLSGPGGQPPQDFPASSFFDIFVQVDVPAGPSFPGATLYNLMPLIVKNPNLTRFPPRVVYLHDPSSIVPILFLNTDTTRNPPLWRRGDILGYFLLAGHGVGFGSTDQQEFNTFMSQQPDASCPIGPPCPAPKPVAAPAQR